MKFRLSLGSSCLVAILVAAAVPASALTPAEEAGILYMKQEEKLAHDLYHAFAARWDLTVFKNITAAEQRHMAAVDNLIASYGLNDSTPIEVGKFSIPELQALHDELLARGNQSIDEALQVGVLVEETDIADLKEAMGATSESMILRVYGHLLRGSSNHLAAFQRVLESGDAAACVGQGQACRGKGKACAAGAGLQRGCQGGSQGTMARGANAGMNCANGPQTCPSAPSTPPPAASKGGARKGR